MGRCTTVHGYIKLLVFQNHKHTELGNFGVSLQLIVKNLQVNLSIKSVSQMTLGCLMKQRNIWSGIKYEAASGTVNK